MAARLFSGSNQMNFVWKNSENATLYSIANSVYILENKIKNEEEFPYEVIIDIYSDLDSEQKQAVSSVLNILIQDVLCEDIKFKLETKKLPEVEDNREFSSCKHVCLFSGGVDSSIGILEALEYYENIMGLYVAHRYTGRIDRKVENLSKMLLQPLKIKLEKFLAPEWRVGYSQTRGFLYLLYAGILANLTKAEKIIISECGQTMYQPKFAPLDTITYTTHPYVLQIAKSVIDLVLGRDIEIVTPFEDFTKSELIKVRPDDNFLSKTHSCITGMWKNNCGKCYACITRMIGSINNNLSLSYFRNNVFQIPDNEDLNALLRFCFDFLYNKEELDFWSFRSIEHFGKSNLFFRVADEVFLALQKLKNNGSLHPNYEFLLDEFTSVDATRLNKRDNELKSLKRPDFNKVVSKYNYLDKG